MVNIKDCCQNCGKSDSQLQNCKHCKIVFYCSDHCKMEDRIEHSKVCTLKHVASASADLDEQNIEFKKEEQIGDPKKDNDGDGDGDGNNRNDYEDKPSISSDDIYDDEADHDNDDEVGYYDDDDEAGYYDDDDDDEEEEATGFINLEDIFNPFDMIHHLSLLHLLNPFTPNLLFNHPLICPRCGDFKFNHVICPKCRRISYCSQWCLLVHYPIHRFMCQSLEQRQCARCKKSDAVLKKCSRCNNVEYCSKICQRTDWELHKTSCKTSKIEDDESYSKKSVKGQCARCKKSDAALKKCSGCNNVEYCSKECQRIDWEQHKTSCKTAKIEDGESSSKTSVKGQCAKCKKSDAALKKCSGCKNVEYCSKVCQTSDWEHHKTSCKTAKIEDGESSSKTSVKGQCGKCKRSYVELTKCTGCNNIEYCSKVCQIADLTNHRISCQTSESKGQCANCTRSMRKCSGCHSVEYCSEECQSAHWKYHKTSCKASKTEDDDSSSKKSVKSQCAKCKKSDVELKKCSACNNVEYCSKVCQTADWKHHKTSCKTSKTEDDKRSHKKSAKGQCAKCKRTDAVLKKCSACNNIEYCSKVCQTADWKHHKTSCKTSKTKDDKHSPKPSDKENFIRTLSHAQWLFPSYKIVHTFSDFEKEDQQGNVLLIVFILSQTYTDNIRRNYLIADIDNYVKNLVFDLIELDPFPYFSWDQLKPGQCICILNPRMYLEYKFFVIHSAEEIRIL